MAGAQRPRAQAAQGDWPLYRHDLAGTGYSPLADVTVANVATLTRAWTYRLAGSGASEAGPSGGAGGAAGAVTSPAASGVNSSTPAVNSQATPIVVNGIMYLPSAGRVVALDPERGTELWSVAVSGSGPSRRGVSYWAGDGALGPRIFVTSGHRLLALDARTGAAVAAFGTSGEVDLGVPYNSVPGVFRNVVIVGANNPPGAIGGVGNPRAYDARSGAKLWEFHTVPAAG